MRRQTARLALPLCLSASTSVLGFPQSKEKGAPFPAALQYRVDAWSERSKLLFQLQVLKIRLIFCPRIEDISDIKLIRTDTTLDLSQKAEKRCTPVVCCPGSPPAKVSLVVVQSFKNGSKNDFCFAAPPMWSWAHPHVLLRTAVCLFTNTQGSAKVQSLPKIALTRGCSSPRKSLVKGERLVRYEEKPE